MADQNLMAVALDTNVCVESMEVNVTKLLLKVALNNITLIPNVTERLQKYLELPCVSF
jgi:hypothetical protein